MANAGGQSEQEAARQSVLALNRGSSSIKFALFSCSPQPAELARGTVDADTDRGAFGQVIARVASPLDQQPLAVVVHRLVHGGPELRAPRRIDDGLIASLEGLIHLAPNHLPQELALVNEVRRARPDLPQVVCFDTEFHGRLPDEARRLPIPAEYAALGVERYGFHGLSYTFLMEEVRRRCSFSAAPARVILAHLGSGSSLAAVRDGCSIDTSMGFTPIGGVVMGTRAGDLDPGVVTHIARLRGFDADRLEEELSHHSGLTGLSAGISDMRELLRRESTDDGCRLAAAIYCYEIKKRIGAYAAALGGLDALVFSGGIGERSPVVRSRICSGLEFLGVRLDEGANAAGAPVISTPPSGVAVHVIHTDEERVMATAAYQLLHDTHDSHT